MGPPRESTKYVPVEEHSAKSKESDDLFSPPEVRCLLRETDTSGQLWLNKMVSPDKQTGVGAKSLPEQIPQKPTHNEPPLRWQQVMGCLSAHSYTVANGVAMAFTSSLIPALRSPDSDLEASEEQCAWLASSIALTVPIGAVVSGFLMEHIGRLATIQITVLPMSLAWVITATATNFTALIIGRVIIGVMSGISGSASTVIITETAVKKYRGSLTSTGMSFASFGIVFAYTVGALFDWRTSAWIFLVTPLVPFVFICLFTAESPLWLRARGRVQKAEKASMYYYGDPDFVVQTSSSAAPQTIPPLQNDIDVEKMAAKQKEEAAKPNAGAVKANYSRQLWMLFSQPSGYKPLIILNVIFLLQQLTGIYITLYYAVTFFQEAGSTFDPYIATILVGLMRFVACTVTAFLLKSCKRRGLMLVSSFGMAFSMAASAYSTSLNLAELDGGDESFLPSWLPIACVVLYILVASVGIQSIPWTMTAELFPQRCRGAAQSANMVFAHAFMFATLQAYPTLSHYLGGSVGVQYLFAGSSLLSALIIWIFFPETHGKTLSEIEDYFAHNIVYLGHNK